MRFSEKLAKKRKENNLSQEQLADKLDVSRQSVSKWESGTSYPDMDKIIQLCKILNCSLDDLIDDDATGNKSINSKKDYNDYLKEFLDFITQTSNMFTSMTSKERWHCILEELIIFVIALLAHSILGDILDASFGQLIRLLPRDAYNIVNAILELIYDLAFLLISIITIVHLFKVRYLNYYVTIKDSSIKEKTIEEPIKENKVSNADHPKEKVIIRDPEHSSYHFLNILGQIIIFILKFIAGCIILMLATFFIMDVAGIDFVATLLNYGIIFLYVMLILLGILGLLYEFILVLYNLIANRKNHALKTFIVLIISIIMIGTGIGMASKEYLSFTPVEDNTKEVQLDIPNNAIIYNDYKYVIDNNVNNLVITYTYSISDSTYYFECNDTYCILNHRNGYEFNLNDAFNYIMNMFKEKKMINGYTDSQIVTIKLSQANYDKIMANKQAYLK